MDPHNVQQESGKTNIGGASTMGVRQSSNRWTPTTEQIRILKELYYNNGVRSPTAEQIQRISAKLRQYGKIEGKNVFYWFQNHKARERQKKRFTTTTTTMTTSTHNSVPFASSSAVVTPDPHPHDHIHVHNNGGLLHWKANEDLHHHHHPHHHHMISPMKFSNFSPSAGNFASSSSASSPQGLLTLGNYGYGSMAVEKSFRECCITPGANGGSMGKKNNIGWIGVDPYSSSLPYPNISDHYHHVDKRTYDNNVINIGTLEFDLEVEEDQEDEDHHQGRTGDDYDAPEIETLPLFPMHGSDDMMMMMKQQTHSTSDEYYFHGGGNGGGWRHRLSESGDTPAAGASLELTLNSYAPTFPTPYP